MAPLPARFTHRKKTNNTNNKAPTITPITIPAIAPSPSEEIPDESTSAKSPDDDETGDGVAEDEGLTGIAVDEGADGAVLDEFDGLVALEDDCTFEAVELDSGMREGDDDATAAVELGRAELVEAALDEAADDPGAEDGTGAEADETAPAVDEDEEGTNGVHTTEVITVALYVH